MSGTSYPACRTSFLPCRRPSSLCRPASKGTRVDMVMGAQRLQRHFEKEIIATHSVDDVEFMKRLRTTPWCF